VTEPGREGPRSGPLRDDAGGVDPGRLRSGRLDPGRTVLMVVDLQERFRAAIPEFASVLAASGKLVRAARILGLPILVTEQYPKGLGRTVGEINDALRSGPTPGEAGEPERFEKTTFSALRARGVAEALERRGPRSVLLCGIEAHVCVAQTVLDLLAGGFSALVAVDAVASRKPLDRETALRRMARAGAGLVTSEAAAFELLEDSAHPRFKEVQGLFK
jgi:nicotinamidase-related amidase